MLASDDAVAVVTNAVVANAEKNRQNGASFLCD